MAGPLLKSVQNHTLVTWLALLMFTGGRKSLASLATAWAFALAR